MVREKQLVVILPLCCDKQRCSCGGKAGTGLGKLAEARCWIGRTFGGVLLVKKRSWCPNAHVLGMWLNVAVCPPPQDLPLQGCGE